MELNLTWPQYGLIEFNGVCNRLESSAAAGNFGKINQVLQTAYYLIQTLTGETLVLKRGSEGGQAGRWEFPGGKADATSDSPLTTADRELLEEASVALTIGPDMVARLHNSSLWELPEPPTLLDDDTGWADYFDDLHAATAGPSLHDKLRIVNNVNAAEACDSNATLVETLSVNDLVGFRLAVEQKGDKGNLLFICRIYRALISQLIPTELLQLSSEHTQAKWLQPRALHSLDWSREIFRLTALASLSLFPNAGSLIHSPESELPALHADHINSNCLLPLQSA